MTSSPGPRLVVVRGLRRPSLVPFVVLIVVLLAIGSIALLLLNTALNKGAFTQERLQREQTQLTQQAQQLRQEIDQESAPGALAREAAKLGMVQVPNPAFLDVRTGQELGDPTPAPSGQPSP